MYMIEINCVQMKFLREFFDDYRDDKVILRVKDTTNRSKITYEADTSLSKEELIKHIKEVFKAKSPYANVLYYTINVL